MTEKEVDVPWPVVLRQEEQNRYQNPGTSARGPNLPGTANTFQEKMQTGVDQLEDISSSVACDAVIPGFSRDMTVTVCQAVVPRRAPQCGEPIQRLGSS